MVLWTALITLIYVLFTFGAIVNIVLKLHAIRIDSTKIFRIMFICEVCIFGVSVMMFIFMLLWAIAHSGHYDVGHLEPWHMAMVDVELSFGTFVPIFVAILSILILMFTPKGPDLKRLREVNQNFTKKYNTNTKENFRPRTNYVPMIADHPNSAQPRPPIIIQQSVPPPIQQAPAVELVPIQPAMELVGIHPGVELVPIMQPAAPIVHTRQPGYY